MEEQKKTTLEEKFAELENILEWMEKDDIGIEEAFAKYSEGMELLKQCDESIDRVEKQVLKLSENGSTEVFEDMKETKAT